MGLLSPKTGGCAQTRVTSTAARKARGPDTSRSLVPSCRRRHAPPPSLPPSFLPFLLLVLLPAPFHAFVSTPPHTYRFPALAALPSSLPPSLPPSSPSLQLPNSPPPNRW
ncbi:hypothetical protein Naga_101769g1 [Nannochloropsis gaditana]|uniref:Uncharacterized protein n=1 Tax=Nannochloropsis gaditana TaxID=72520 RepID=W7T9P7_9STRA|nr:hypothetical protein Naga_101769g1 [Nannochloropsis gaditana]